MWLALHAGGSVDRLVLSNTAARIGTAAAWDERIATVQRGGLSAIAGTVPLRWFTPTFLADAEASAAQQAMLLRCSAAGYVAASAAVRDADLRNEIGVITAPTLVLSGASDTATSPAKGEALAAAIPSARLHLVPGAHLSNIEASEAYNAALLPFLLNQEINQ